MPQLFGQILTIQVFIILQDFIPLPIVRFPQLTVIIMKTAVVLMSDFRDENFISSGRFFELVKAVINLAFRCQIGVVAGLFAQVVLGVVWQVTYVHTF
jgi:hypothetical protein